MIYPSADEVARAIVVACRMCGEDPIQLAEGRKGLRSRYYVFGAIREAYPDLPPKGVGLMLGLTPAASRQFPSNYYLQFIGRKYFDQWLLDRVRAELSPPTGPMPAAPVLTIRPSLTSASGRRYIPPAIASDKTGALMGDPPPGRSALDRAASDG